jgi:tRNA threonylcarbamoyladenosine biosynthesis protein TsaB
VSADGEIIAALSHEQPSAHAERVLGLIERSLADAGITREMLDRVAVGVGPGSFTGLRVGIALGQGIALGLDRPLVGVGSLRAMAHAVPATDRRVRVAVLDARRGELFVAAYAPDGAELLAPSALTADDARGVLRSTLAGLDVVLIGEGASLLGDGFEVLHGNGLDLPDASAIAFLGAELDPEAASAEPVYVRGAGATLPNLPPSPLDPPLAAD